MRKVMKSGFLVFLALGLMGLSSFETLFAPRKELWQHWLTNDAHSKAVIDHGGWQSFLDRFLSTQPDGSTVVAYDKVDAAGKQSLEDYIESLLSLPIARYNGDEQFAFWVNLYNALTVKVILDHHPVESIRDIDISPGLFADGPWGKKLITFDGQELSLNDIEHRILRPIWNDPRIHYAVNCASIGCPNLQDKAFTADNREFMLDKGAREFINSPRGVWSNDQGLWVSSIYAWFPEDFGKSDAALLEHLKSYAADDLRARLEKVQKLENHDYDWRLNQTP